MGYICFGRSPSWSIQDVQIWEWPDYYRNPCICKYGNSFALLVDTERERERESERERERERGRVRTRKGEKEAEREKEKKRERELDELDNGRESIGLF